MRQFLVLLISAFISISAVDACIENNAEAKETLELTYVLQKEVAVFKRTTPVNQPEQYASQPHVRVDDNALFHYIRIPYKYLRFRKLIC